MTLTESQAQKITAQQAALTRNAEIRRVWGREMKATRPLTLEEWRKVKPSMLRRGWLRIVQAITEQLTTIAGGSRR